MIYKIEVAASHYCPECKDVHDITEHWRLGMYNNELALLFQKAETDDKRNVTITKPYEKRNYGAYCTKCARYMIKCSKVLLNPQNLPFAGVCK